MPSVNVCEKIRSTITYQVTQLITDHGNMWAYLYHRKLAAQPTCECEGGPKYSEHILFHCPLETEARNEAKTKMQKYNLEWPRNFTEVKRLADKIRWWEALATFAAKVERLTTDGNNGTDREGSGSESTAAKQRKERRREWRARTVIAGYTREDIQERRIQRPGQQDAADDGLSNQGEEDRPQLSLPGRLTWGSV